MRDAVRIRPTRFIIVGLYRAGGYEPPLQWLGDHRLQLMGICFPTQKRYRAVLRSPGGYTSPVRVWLRALPARG